MKKTLIIALAGMMLFAFTQCGGSSKGSKEFQDSKELLNKLETAVKDAKTCDELKDAALGLLFGSFATPTYTDEEKMTESEKAEIEKLHGILTSNGAKLGEVKEWGLRAFAYPINKQVKGYYVVLKLTADDAALNEFSRLAKINPNVVRHLFTVDQD